MAYLTGHWGSSVDSRRRLHVPADVGRYFSDELRTTAVWVGHAAELECAVILTPAGYEDLMKLFDDDTVMATFDEGPCSNYLRHSLTSFREEKITNGRIPISEPVLRWAGIDPKEQEDSDDDSGVRVMVIGFGKKKLEIWDPEKYEKSRERGLAAPVFLRPPVREQVVTELRPGVG
ncbi:MAG: hypothetical protein ABI743_00675 [bacterium]